MKVTRDDILRVAQTYLHPEGMDILAVGHAEEIQLALEAFGEVHELQLDPVE